MPPKKRTPKEHVMKNSHEHRNELGGSYLNGRPLCIEIRKKIIELRNNGHPICTISKKLQVTHGCISKILARYRLTGSAEAGRIGGSKPKVATPAVLAAIRRYRNEDPSIFAKSIRMKLIVDNVCEGTKVPCASSINRIIANKLSVKNKDHYEPEVKTSGPSSKTASHRQIKSHGRSADVARIPRPKGVLAAYNMHQVSTVYNTNLASSYPGNSMGGPQTARAPYQGGIAENCTYMDAPYDPPHQYYPTQPYNPNQPYNRNEQYNLNNQYNLYQPHNPNQPYNPNEQYNLIRKYNPNQPYDFNEPYEPSNPGSSMGGFPTPDPCHLGQIMYAVPK